MATIKSYTDIKQSKKLAEILPLESADYCWGIDYESRNMDFNRFPYTEPYNEFNNNEDFIPCWSLSALLDVLPNGNMLVKTTEGGYYCLSKYSMTKHYDNPIDACYEMILRLRSNLLL